MNEAYASVIRKPLSTRAEKGKNKRGEEHMVQSTRLQKHNSKAEQRKKKTMIKYLTT